MDSVCLFKNSASILNRIVIAVVSPLVKNGEVWVSPVPNSSFPRSPVIFRASFCKEEIFPGIYIEIYRRNVYPIIMSDSHVGEESKRWSLG